MNLLTSLFLDVLNMSLVAVYVILAVLLLRLLLKRAPKRFSYCLWFLVLFRLLCPFSLESAFSLLPVSQQPVPQDIIYQAVPRVDTGLPVVDEVISSRLPAAVPTASANPLQVWLAIAAAVWLVGMAGLLAYGTVSYCRFAYRLREATLVEAGLLESDRISGPFVLGFFRPRIYLPKGLDPQVTASILLHERCHIRRGDHLIKPLAYVALCLHWFNPLVWLAFALFTKDMELSCDEAVMRQAAGDIRRSYSQSLLSVSRRQSGLFAPLAFGENCVKSRIKNVLAYRQPMTWVILISAAAVAIMLLTLGTNPRTPTLPTGNGSAGLWPLDDGGAVPGDNQRQLAPSEIATVEEMADTWALCLQTRDGRPRYDMMSAAAQEKFIAGQKERAGDGGTWYFNIGGSSPKIDSWEISFDPQTGRADILYAAADSGGEQYTWKELVYFAQVAGEWKVVDYQDLGIEGVNAEAYYETAAAAADAYIQALQQRDYASLAQMTWGDVYTWEGQEIWNTVNISRVIIVQTDIREEKACYELKLTVADPGASAFSEGENPRWLWLVKREYGWMVWGLMSSGAPDDAWWQNPLPESQGQSASPTTQISGLLADIMASPKASSDPGDYIAAHHTEFQRLVAVGRGDLTAYYQQMDGSQQNGLAGEILKMALSLQSVWEDVPENTGE